MVSFQCDGCGDVLTKKKLDAHYNRCANAAFSCLDCMTSFRGYDYRAHTSCISEDQKYQGALYKEKPAKKSVKIAPLPTQHPPKAYVEDAPDAEDSGDHETPATEGAQAPKATPKSNHQTNTPHATKMAPEKESDGSEMDYTPSILGSDVKSKRSAMSIDSHYDKRGFSYGNEPIPGTVRKERPRVEYITPNTRDIERDLRIETELARRREKSTEKKRKRSHGEDRLQEDAVMVEAAPALHTGLTGGLSRLLGRSSSSRVKADDEVSPVAQHTLFSQAIAHRDRSKNTAPVEHVIAPSKVKKRRTTSAEAAAAAAVSDADGERRRKKKKKKKTRVSDEHDGSTATEIRPKRKALDHHPSSRHDEPHNDSQLILHPHTRTKSQSGDQGMSLASLRDQQGRAHLFLSLITKGEDSARGMSMHKVLKRYHRETKKQLQIAETSSSSRAMVTRSGKSGEMLDREDEEKELWKGLRLRKNERGEIVVFLDASSDD